MVLQQIAQIWTNEPNRVRQSRNELMQHLEKVTRPSAPGHFDISQAEAARAHVLRAADPVYGGIGDAPKFPNVGALSLLWVANPDAEPAAKEAVKLALTQMSQGGIYDHLAGGFARYTVDEAWLIPHFEKMLYDNALLIRLLSEVWQSEQNPLYAERVAETIDWLTQEMLLQHGFASSLDADSEGIEGKFYVWKPAEIFDCLGLTDAPYFCAAYDITDEGNFEGNSILNRLKSPDRRSGAEEARLAALRGKLKTKRDSRIRPGRDDKILVDWNALACDAILRAGFIFHREDWIALGHTTLETLLARHATEHDGALFLIHATLDTSNGPAGLAEDYANTICACLTLYETTGDPRGLELADKLRIGVERHFLTEQGVFEQAPKTADDVIVSATPIYDSAVPPANATMADNYSRLAALTGNTTHSAKAEKIFEVFGGIALKVPGATPTLIRALCDHYERTTIVVCEPDTKSSIGRDAPLIDALLQQAPPALTWVWAEPEAIYDLLHPAHGKTPQNNALTAYVCRGTRCSAPITHPSQVAAAFL